ncbi:MAG: radical SAM protein [Candidatus Micrarchaeia archaeon]
MVPTRRPKIEVVNENEDYALRISLPQCNLRCSYCRTQDYNIPKAELITNRELLDIIRAAYENGIRRVRWTGGEPTVNPQYLDLVRKTKEIGITQQMLSTNGTTLAEIGPELAEAGINRVNISLDTLDSAKFKKITGYDMLDKVLEGIDLSTKLFEKVKINTVLTRDSFEESTQLIDFLDRIQKTKGNVAIRFIELIPGGFEGDKEYTQSNFIGKDELIKKMKTHFGSVTRTTFEGDNPKCEYYKIKNKKVVFGVIPHFSVNFQCGGKRCRKLRLNPTGIISNCSIHKSFGHDLRNTTYEKKVTTLAHLIEEKKARTEEDFNKLKHFQSDYAFWRFGIKSKNK